MSSEIDVKMMRLAMEQAEKARALGEIPIGAVIARGDEVISTGHNLRETKKHSLAHAEIVAINEACQKLKGWRLIGCTLYVTLEPCPMCAGAIMNSRIDRVVFGALDPKAGCFGSLIDFSAIPFNHTPKITAGVLSKECGELISSFFLDLRKGKKQ